MTRDTRCIRQRARRTAAGALSLGAPQVDGDKKLCYGQIQQEALYHVQMSLQRLPPDLVGRIFDGLDTKERARLAVLCKNIRWASETCCSVMKLAFHTLRDLELLRGWLQQFTERALPSSVREFELHWQGGSRLHPMPGTLYIERFIGLETLCLKTPERATCALSSRAIQRLGSLKQLKHLELAFTPDDISRITLEEFAAFPKLQTLSVSLVQLHMHDIRDWLLDFSPELEGLVDLTKLCLSNRLRLHITPTARTVLERLKHVGLLLTIPAGQSLGIPNAEFLRYEASIGDFPFRASSQLKELQTDVPAVLHCIEQFSGLCKLKMGSTVSLRNESAKQLLPLKQLQELQLQSYHAAEVETFECLAQLSRLEKLALVIEAGDAGLRTALLTQLPRLRSLSLYAHVDDDFRIEGGFEGFPVLEILHLETSRFSQPISSPTLRCLAVEGGPCSLSHKYPVLGDLPQIRNLQLKLVPGLSGCLALAGQLAALPQLRELFLVKGSCRGTGSACLSEEEAGLFERLLHSLKQLRGLEILQVAAVNDNVSLSRIILPQVKHFALACKGLSVCHSCLPWTLPSIELVFRTASRPTLELLEHSMDVTRDEAYNVHFCRARYPWSTGAALPCKFDDNLLADVDEYDEFPLWRPT